MIRRLVLVAALFAVPACGSDDDGGDDGGATIDADPGDPADAADDPLPAEIMCGATAHAETCTTATQLCVRMGAAGSCVDLPTGCEGNVRTCANCADGCAGTCSEHEEPGSIECTE
jgi:hypothetical protein